MKFYSFGLIKTNELFCKQSFVADHFELADFANIAISHLLYLQCFTMPPNATTLPSNLIPLTGELNHLKESKQTGVLFETDADTNDGALDVDIRQFKKAEKRPLQLVWRNILLFGYLHLAAVYGGYLFFAKAKWATVFFCKYLYGVLEIFEFLPPQSKI